MPAISTALDAGEAMRQLHLRGIPLIGLATAGKTKSSLHTTGWANSCRRPRGTERVQLIWLRHVSQRTLFYLEGVGGITQEGKFT